MDDIRPGNRKSSRKRPAGRYGIVLARVVEYPGLSLQAKGIYGLIAASMNDEREVARLSVALIAKRAGISRRYAQKLLRELEHAGVVRRISGDRKISEWHLTTYDALASELLFARSSEQGFTHTPNVNTPEDLFQGEDLVTGESDH